MRQDELDYYENHFMDTQRQGIVYMPMIYTAYGRRHPSATKMSKHAATMVTRQQGQANAMGLLSHSLAQTDGSRSLAPSGPNDQGLHAQVGSTHIRG